MGEPINYTLMPSLEHIALVKIVVALCNQDDIRALIGRFYFKSLIISERLKEWHVVEDKVIEKVPKLLLPELLKKKVLDFIKPIGLEILKWRDYHERFLSGKKFVIVSLNKLCWTPQGTVDKKKTAEALIKDERVDITNRYKLACIYCLEDDVRKLWNSIPQRKKAAFNNEIDPRFPEVHKLLVFWTLHIKGEVAKLNSWVKKLVGKEISPYQFAFENATQSGNKIATEYFLQKLTPREREKSLVCCVEDVAYSHNNYICYPIGPPKEYFTDVLCFLLSQMSEEQQVKAFKSYTYVMLKCLLDWPWQSFFMKTVNCMWAFFHEGGFKYFLEIINDKVIDGYKDSNYQILFGEFWQQSPITHKKFVIDKCVGGALLKKLFKVKDKKNISLILKSATVAEKEKIIFDCEGKNICESLAHANEWDLLEFFISECISSQEKMIKFKEEFKTRIVCCCSKKKLEEGKDMRCKFFELLDNLIQKDDRKRNMCEKQNSSPAKRLCSLTE